MENGYYAEVKNQEIDTDTPPLVSVVMTAYNVGGFLEEAIESVLSQTTNFRVELVIGENCSQDNSREIVRAYKEKYPNVIKALLHEKNIGLTPNSIATQDACTGKYIAFCDGDDYWTNSNKLQKQIEFLEGAPDFSSSCHQATVVYEDQSTKSHPFGAPMDKTFDVNDTIGDRKFHTSSLVYRREIWDKAGGIPANILSNDRAIYLMVGVYGKIKYFKEAMCIYRKSGFGISSNATMNDIAKDVNMIPWIKKMDKKFPYVRFKSFLHLCIYQAYNGGLLNTDLGLFVKHYLLFVYFSFAYFPKNLGDVKFGTIQFFRVLGRNA